MLKQKILEELNKTWFPGLKLIYSEEALEISLEILNELLEKEKEDFKKLLKTKKEDINFETFEDESILDYYWSLLNHLSWVNNTEKIREIIESFRPKLEDFSNYVSYNKKYYEMIVYCDENCNLDEEQKRVMFLRLKWFKDRWINLDNKKQKRLKQINKKLSKLSHDFTNNIIDDEATFEYLITNKEIIKDLPEDILENALKEAEQKKKNWYLFSADPSSYMAIMKYSGDKDTRKYFQKTRSKFASSWKYDNRKIILDILKYKKEKAIILWYKNYAELSLNNKMATSPKEVIKLMKEISTKAKDKALEEIETLKKYFNLRDLRDYDLAYYSTKYKKENYDLDDKYLKQFFEYENVLSYLHNLAKDFFWVELKEIKENCYQENVKIYEVYKDNNLISYYFLDPYYRKEKRAWAWADIIREKTYEIKAKNIKNKLPIVVNVCNFQKWEKNTLLTMSDVETIFHEFWHALHAMLAESKYSDLNWFEVEWDFVELPSQLLENWVIEKESLKKLAKHYKTWATLDKKTLDKLENLKTFMSWNFVLKQCEYTLLDMNLHIWNIPNWKKELDETCLDLINKISLFNKEKDYKMYCSFNHIFWWWYSAWYYSYMWAEIIEAQVFNKIKKNWIFDKKIWSEYINTILWPWTKKPANDLFYDFVKDKLDIKYFYERKWI